MVTRHAIIGEIDGGDGDDGMYVDVDMLELVKRAEPVGLDDFSLWGVTLMRNRRKCTERSG